MNRIESELLDRLRELEEVVQQGARGPGSPSLAERFAHLDRLAAQLPPDGDPQLRHFLERKSYAKARERLEGRVPARGSCSPERRPAPHG